MRTESQTASSMRFEEGSFLTAPAELQPRSAAETTPVSPPGIQVSKSSVNVDGKLIEVFTMALGPEKIELLPHKNWSQLDTFKWSMRGKLPGTPAGLEIAHDHIKVAGGTVSPKDPDACLRLERLFAKWLAVELEGAALARRKAQAKASSNFSPSSISSERPPRHFEVEIDKEGQVHIHCLQGKEKLASIGLNPAGFQSLVNQGLLRKPHALKTGVLHDWVELDGVLYSFEKGNDDSSRLAEALNEHYIPASNLGRGNDILIFANAASSTGFDIQFPAKVGGVPENKRRPLDETALELLQDPQRCGLLHEGLVVKLTRPTLIFKRKTADGGERYLERSTDSLLKVTDDDGGERTIDLSQPVNYLHLNPLDLTAMFNHPAINRHSPTTSVVSERTANAKRSEPPPAHIAPTRPPPAHPPQSSTNSQPLPPEDRISASETAPRMEAPRAPVEASHDAVPARPNQWLKHALAQTPIRHDWLTCLVYGRLATRIGNSRESQLLNEHCWVIALSDIRDANSPQFKGIFRTEKGAFGFLGADCLVDFESGAIRLGPRTTLLRGEPGRLVAVARDHAGRLVFIISNECRPKFGAGESVVQREISKLRENGAVLMSVNQVLESPIQLQVVWTVPAEQTNPADPQVVEHTPPH